jgi:hypothetical protein
MKTIKERVMQIAMIGLLGVSCLLTVGALMTTTASARAAACDGLGCTDASDCGTKCFCNRPSQTCYLDSVDVIE